MKQTQQKIVSHAELRPHRMGFLYKDVSDTYPMYQQAVQELVQNAIDVDARNIEVLINAQGKFAFVCDNGMGATETEFNHALGSIGKTTKAKDKFGRFGRGLISPLGKCREFTFTSRGKKGPFHRWTFHCKEILESENVPLIPCEDIGRGSGQWWRTQILMKGVKFGEDAVKYAVNVNELKSSILSRFATRMRLLGTVVKITYIPSQGAQQTVTFSAKSYTGKPLPVWEIDGTPAGKVIVRLYRAKDGASSIPVTIGQIGDPFRLDWRTFYSSVTNGFARRRVTFEGRDINDLLRSGLLEGEIECENITIHPEREKFERNEALDWFVVALEEWYGKVGKEIYVQAQINAKSSWYQEMAIEATKRIENHPLLGEFLRFVKFGSVGHGHASVDGTTLGEVIGKSATSGQDKGKGTHAPEDMTVNKPEDKVTRPGHVPMVVDGPEGSKRTIVRGESKGLRIAVEPFVGQAGIAAPLFRVEIDQGKVVINQLAPVFAACSDRGKSTLLRYYDMVVIAALQSAIATDSTKVQGDLEQYIRYATSTFLKGDQRSL